MESGNRILAAAQQGRPFVPPPCACAPAPPFRPVPLQSLLPLIRRMHCRLLLHTDDTSKLIFLGPHHA